MLPRFSKVKQSQESADTDLEISWGTSKIILSKKSLKNDFDNGLYPNQRIRHFAAMVVMALLHLLIVYFLLQKSEEQLEKLPQMKEHLVFLSLLAKDEAKTEAESPPAAPVHLIQPRKPQKGTRKRPTVSSSKRSSAKLANKAPINMLSQIAAAREKRELQQKELETEAARQDKEVQLASQPKSENDIALARIKANVAAATYNRKGVNGIFQVLHKGVQTGKFSFRGWTNDIRESNWQTYEVDAGVGGNVEQALVRRMIQIIRQQYSGDFNWDSQRLGRVVVLSARPADNAKLEAFLMREFFG